MNGFHDVPELIEDIKSGEPDRKQNAIKKVIDIFQHEDPFKVLQQLLQVGADFREEIKPLLIVHNLTVNVLAELLESTDDSIVNFAVRSLGKIGTRAILANLSLIVKEHKEISIRINALEAISNIKDVKAIPLLAEFARDINDKICEVAVCELSQLQQYYSLDLEIIEVIESLKNDTNQKIKYLVNKTLFHIYDAKWCNAYPYHKDILTLSYGPFNISVHLPDNDHVDIRNIVGRPPAKLRDLLLAVAESDAILMAQILVDNWRIKKNKQLQVQWLSEKENPVVIREAVAYAIITMTREFWDVREALLFTVENIIKDKEENLNIIALSKRIAGIFCSMLIRRKNTLNAGISLLLKLIELTPTTTLPFDLLSDAYTTKLVDDRNIQINKNTYMNYEKGIYFAQKKLDFIRDNNGVVYNEDKIVDATNRQIELLKLMKEIVAITEPGDIRVCLIDYLYEEFEKRKKDFFVDIGLKWQLLCDEIASAVYDKVLLATRNETTLSNNSKPDIIIDDGSIQRDEEGKISDANFIIEVKKKTLNEEDTYKYTPHCTKLSVWVLEGFDISVEEHRKYCEFLDHLITVGEEGKILDNWLRLRKNQLDEIKHYLKVEIVTAQALISQLKNMEKGDLINRIVLLKKQSDRIDLTIVEQIKYELLQLSAKELRYVLKKSKSSDGEIDTLQMQVCNSIRETLEKAINDNIRVSIVYYSKSEGVINRDIDPYKIEDNSWGQTYILAFCHLTNSLRTFRLDKIKGVSLTNIEFELPKNIDIKAPIKSFFNFNSSKH